MYFLPMNTVVYSSNEHPLSFLPVNTIAKGYDFQIKNIKKLSSLHVAFFFL